MADVPEGGWWPRVGCGRGVARGAPCVPCGLELPPHLRGQPPPLTSMASPSPPPWPPWPPPPRDRIAITVPSFKGGVRLHRVVSSIARRGSPRYPQR